MNRTPYRNMDSMLQEALEGVKKAVQGEKEDEMFYDYLISAAPTQQEKDIITTIRNDERLHNATFRKIYKDFTGSDVPAVMDTPFIKPISYVEGIKTALMGELAAVDRYKKIRDGLPMGPYKDMLYNIITDEQKHASKYNYLFALNTMPEARSVMEYLPYKMEKMMPKEMPKEAPMEMPKMEMPKEMPMNMGNEMPMKTDKDSKMTMNMGMGMADRSHYTPDDWVRYIRPLVDDAMKEYGEGINLTHLFEEFILAGVLVGMGKMPMDAIAQVEMWEKSGTSKLLSQSRMMG